MLDLSLPPYMHYTGATLKILIYLMLHPNGSTATEIQQNLNLHTVTVIRSLGQLRRDETVIIIGHVGEPRHQMNIYKAIVANLYTPEDEVKTIVEDKVWQSRLTVLKGMVKFCEERVGQG